MGLLSYGKRIVKNISRLGKRMYSNAQGLGRKVARSVSNLIPEPTHDAFNLDDETKFYAKIAEQSYKEPDMRVSVDGYELDEELSDLRTAVYHNPNKKDTVIGYRGTVIGDADDFLTDAEIYKGTHRNTSQFINAENSFEKAREKYGTVNAVAGHSLGGTKSKHISKKYNVKAHAFNTGVGKDETYVKDTLNCMLPSPPVWCDKLTTHKVIGDPISFFSGGYGNTRTYRTKKRYNNHSLSNFLE